MLTWTQARVSLQLILVSCGVKQRLALGGSQLPLLCAGIFPFCVAAFRVPLPEDAFTSAGCRHAVPFLFLAGMMGWPFSGFPQHFS